MGNLKYILIIVLLSLSSSLQAKTITIDSIKFQSKDSSLIDMYLAARDQYQAARKHYDSIREGYSNHLATIEDYTKAKNDSSAAYEKMLALESKLDIVPTIPEGESSKWSEDELRQQYAEAGKVKDMLTAIRENSKNKNAYQKRLQNILKQFKGHAAESSILIALGELNENSPKKAIKYYEEAAKGPVPSGEWNFEQQLAWQKLAEMYEKNKQFKEAVKALENWEISEPCGNGSEASGLWRSYKILELKLHYIPQDKVFEELWHDLEYEKMTYGFLVGFDSFAQQIRKLYGNERLDLLKNTVKEFRLRYPKKDNDSEEEVIFEEGYHFLRLLIELESQLQLVEKIENASLQEALEILKTVRSDKKAPSIHGHLTDLNFPSKNNWTQLWREEMLVAKLLSFPAEESVPAISAFDNEHYECCALYALGKIGNKEAVEYLLFMAQTEFNLSCLKDYYFCLHLTNNKSAEYFLKDAAANGTGNNRTAAEWVFSLE